MPSFIRRPRHPGHWNPLQVPIGPVTIDRSHRLAQNLMAYYLPGGASRLADLTGMQQNVAITATGNIVQGAGGPAFYETADGGLATSIVTPSLLSSRSLSIVWRGRARVPVTGSGTGCAGIAYSNPNLAPYNVLSVYQDATTGNLYTNYNNGNSAGLYINWNAPMPNVMTTLVLSSDSVAGIIKGWIGKSIAFNVSVQTGAPLTTATSSLNTGPRNGETEFAAFYARTLTQDDVNLFTDAPYDMLCPIPQRRRVGADSTNSAATAMMGV